MSVSGVKCMLCGEEFRTITSSHLKRAHSLTVGEYRGMFPNAELTCWETRLQISDSVHEMMTEELRGQISRTEKGRVVSDETCQKMSEGRRGIVVGEETRRLLSIAAKGRPYHGCEVSEGTRKRLSVVLQGNKNALGHKVSELVRQQQSERVKSREVSESTKQLQSETMTKVWREPEYQQRWAEGMNMKPNESELQLQSVLDRYFPGEWEYVGDGKDAKNRFKGRNPDFIRVNGRKQVIEMFGLYWHDTDLFPNRPTEEELIAHYKKCNIDCLVFWEHEIWDDVVVVEKVKALREEGYIPKDWQFARKER